LLVVYLPAAGLMIARIQRWANVCMALERVIHEFGIYVRRHCPIVPFDPPMQFNGEQSDRIELIL